LLPSFGAAAVVLLLAAPSPAVDQGDAPEAEKGEARAQLSEEILVTGSRLPRKDLSTPAPVTVIGRDDLARSGAPTLGEYLRDLPAALGALNRQVNNGSDGSARVNLRGMGEHRNLVLLNGRRVVPGGSGADMAIDLNAIPMAAVERVEILKDGASPIYGSDAMSGVINVVTRRRWTGLEVATTGGVSWRGDGGTAGFDVALGRSGEDASFLVGGSLHRMGAAMAGDRPWSAKPYAWDYATGIRTFAGSPTVPQGTVVVTSSERGLPNGNTLWNDLVTAHPSTRRFVRDPSAPLGWRPLELGDLYNYQPENYLMTPLRLASLFASGEGTISGETRFRAETAYVHRASEQRLAPLPLLTATLFAGGVSADNVYNPFGRDFANVQRRLLEVGARRFAQEADTIHASAAVDGNASMLLGPGARWEIAASLGRSSTVQSLDGFLSGRMLQAALGPSFIDPGPNGVVDTPLHQTLRGDDVAVCGTQASPIAGCVPLDLFGGPGSITPAMLRQLTYSGTTRGTSELVSIQAGTTAELLTLDAARPVALAAGYEYRNTFGEFVPDTLALSGDRLDVEAGITKGRTDVHELYAELAAPITEGRPYAELLEAMAAARAFRHRSFSADWTWKVGARWRPIRDVTLRGTASTSYRVPAVPELFAGRTLYDTNFTFDPCADLDPASNPGATPSRIAACQAAGVPAGGTGSFQPVPAPTSGNPLLRPETGRVFTAGLVLEPRFVPSLSLTADLWWVKVERTIAPPGGYLILDSCYPGLAGLPPRFCELVDRDPATGVLRGVADRAQNLGSSLASGLDLALRQEIATRWGRLGLSVEATWLARRDLSWPGVVVHARGNYDAIFLDPTGTFGLSAEWKAAVGASWALGGLRLGAVGRYVSPVRECASLDPGSGTYYSDACSLGAQYSRRIDAWFGLDLALDYELRTSAGRSRLGAVLRNALDRAPPFATTNETYRFDPGAYDAMGRFLQVRASHAF
jgi:outer membrane receptor protein involved in Fe transport